ncbi:hypothetical protein RA280_36505 [Cupriavidus sp. CV2]|uniref:hypothetical protein n=1 Tax=Cupriavidus ulmosensis TaxID=3065913 RepID=UPI00296AF99A|nr:hypothetical protein [Cupriavidus sp. CV2]MDW3687146.1 hypothetical protein [Cupriavidus sp. CV2]
MSKEARRTVVVVYRSHPKNWFFAEVDGGCIDRFGPFESEKIVNDILLVIYPAGLPRETLTAMMDCDDGTLLRTAQGVACPPPPGSRPIELAQTQSFFSAGASWRALFSRCIQGWMAGGAVSR